MTAPVKRQWTASQRAAQEARTAARRAARIENVEWMLTFDNNAASVARRAGFTTPAAAARYLNRAGRGDLAALMVRYGTPTIDVYHPDYGNPEAARPALAGRAA